MFTLGYYAGTRSSMHHCSRSKDVRDLCALTKSSGWEYDRVFNENKHAGDFSHNK